MKMLDVAEYGVEEISFIETKMIDAAGFPWKRAFDIADRAVTAIGLADAIDDLASSFSEGWTESRDRFRPGGGAGGSY